MTLLKATEFSAVTQLVFAASNGELPAELDEVQMMVVFGKLSRVLYRLETPYDAVSLMPAMEKGKRPLDEFVID